MRKPIFVIILCAGMVCFIKAQAFATMYSITQITNNERADISPQINNLGQVVYLHRYGTMGYNVMLYDHSKGTTSLIGGGDAAFAPQINNSGRAVWYEMSGGLDIAYYDSTTNSTTQLTNDSIPDVNPQINDSGQVVWVRGINNSIEIFLYDIAKKETTQITNTNSVTEFNPMINNSGQVVFYRGGVGTILYDINNKTEKLISSSGNSEYSINDSGQVVWQTQSDGSPGSEIIFYDPSTGITQLTTNERADIDPQINNLGQVVYLWKYGTMGYNVKFYDHSKGTTSLIGGGDAAFAPQINNSGRAVWYEQTGWGLEIAHYDSTTSSTTQLTNNSIPDKDPQINDSGQMVWVGGDGDSAEIFFASVGPAKTPSGSNVVVRFVPTDTTAGETPVTITFDQVDVGGETTVTTTPSSPSPPAGFKIGDMPTYYIETTASFTDSATICIDYPDTSPGNENNLRLFHENGAGGWDDITSSIDTSKNIICGRTSQFSRFAIVEPTIVCNPSAPVSIQAGTVNCSYSLLYNASITSASWDWGDGETSVGVIDTNTTPPQVSGTHYYLDPGVYTVQLTIQETSSGWSDTFRYVVAYDPYGGFVTGGGWIVSPSGAYTLAPTFAGKATFGFVSKYQKGSTVPTGNTEFLFHVANFSYRSTAYDWLLIAGAKAQFKGIGTVNGNGNYGFILSAIDGQSPGGGGTDKFRIKIWDRSTDSIVYDNQMGASENVEPSTMIGGGSIVIHK